MITTSSQITLANVWNFFFLTRDISLQVETVMLSSSYHDKEDKLNDQGSIVSGVGRTKKD